MVADAIGLSAQEANEHHPQALPRGVDHAKDMAILSQMGKHKHKLWILVLDFKDAFMSIPLADAEKPYNCAVIPEGITRDRPQLDSGEPQHGTCIVWNVLGFGGKPNPLVYSRIASFARRTGQALFNGKVSDLARVRSQLYVDDPAVCFVGDEENLSASVDLLLTWWLVLGIPLLSHGAKAP